MGSIVTLVKSWGGEVKLQSGIYIGETLYKFGCHKVNESGCVYGEDYEIQFDRLGLESDLLPLLEYLEGL